MTPPRGKGRSATWSDRAKLAAFVNPKGLVALLRIAIDNTYTIALHPPGETRHVWRVRVWRANQTIAYGEGVAFSDAVLAAAAELHGTQGDTQR